MAIHRTPVKLNARLPYFMESKSGWYRVRCELLQITGAGRSRLTALKSFRESFALLMEGAYEDRNVKELLSGYGLEKEKKAGISVWKAPKSLMEKYANLEQMAFVTTIHPRLEFPDSDPSWGHPMVIAGTEAANANRLPI